MSWLAAPASGADKIRFSDQPSGIKTPKPESKDKPVAESFEFMNRKSSFSGVIQTPTTPTPTLPNILRSQKALQEYYDKRDWIFTATPESGGTNALEKLFPDKDEEAAEGETHVKRGVERYLELQEQKKEASQHKGRLERKPRSEETDEEERTDAEPADEKAAFTKGRPASDANRPGESARFADKAPRPGSERAESAFTLPSFKDQLRPFSLGPGPSANTAFRDRQTRTEDQRRRLDLPSSVTPVAGSLDLLKLQPDFTRQDMNPISAPSTKDLSAGPAKPEGAKELRLAKPDSPTGKSSFLDDLQAKSLGDSSLSPAVFTPPEPLTMKAKPAVLEIPRRPF